MESVHFILDRISLAKRTGYAFHLIFNPSYNKC